MAWAGSHGAGQCGRRGGGWTEGVTGYLADDLARPAGAGSGSPGRRGRTGASRPKAGAAAPEGPGGQNTGTRNRAPPRRRPARAAAGPEQGGEGATGGKPGRHARPRGGQHAARQPGPPDEPGGREGGGGRGGNGRGRTGERRPAWLPCSWIARTARVGPLRWVGVAVPKCSWLPKRAPQGGGRHRHATPTQRAAARSPGDQRRRQANARHRPGSRHARARVQRAGHGEGRHSSPARGHVRQGGPAPGR